MSSSPEIRFRFVDSQLSRVIHVDGVWGGIMADGIDMAIFSQHHHVPEWVNYEVESSGRLANETSRALVDDVVRTIEAHLLFTVDTARVMRDWLSERIDILSSQAQSLGEEPTND